jgi:hypothetical protein
MLVLLYGGVPAKLKWSLRYEIELNLKGTFILGSDLR